MENKKSKFLAFLLSFIPGMSHFYIGYSDRGIIYLILTGAILMGSIGLMALSGSGEFILFFVAAYPIIWLISLIDVFSVINKRSTSSGNTNFIEGDEVVVENTKFLNKKMITLALSIVPGAGHMYLGQQKKGLSFMSMFFFSMFFMGWLRLNFLVFLLPVIWFYVFFDAFHLVNGKDTEDFDIVSFLPKVSNALIGKILIVTGIIMVFNNVVYPIIGQYLYLGYELANYIQTSIVAIILIGMGMKMLKTKKEILRGEEDED